jgi:SnoaL-like domain
LAEIVPQEGGVARIEDLEARAAIADLVHRYALNIRTGNPADCAKLFTEDVIFEIRDAPFGSSSPAQTRSRLTGRDETLSYLIRAAGSETRVCPLIHNLLVHVSGSEATSSCVMTSVVWPGGRQMIGEYDDRYRYESGWRFVSRVFTIMGEFGSGPTRDLS